ncbi:coiled-coil domain-containing protein [Phytohabitans kaempferiae]|uniref:Coiled-coil domain-containing protein n=1 Tax=Phytohabitans kaempferiae TaxID=1620943 RepID=A0ABV6LW80_9ACTN
MTAPVRRRRWSLAVALAAAAAVLLSGVAFVPSGAAAAPKPTPGDEGGTPLLRDVLESSSRGYVEAQNAVTKSRNRQLQLTLELRKAEEKIKLMEPEIELVAITSYRNGRIGPMSMLLNSASPDDFLRRAVNLDLLAARDNAKLGELNAALEQARRAKAAIDAELKEEQKQLAIMAKQKSEAEKALKLVGGKATGGFVSATSPVARPAPRNSNGSFSSQSCSADDPTTGRCITPRTLHMLKETQRLGFKRFVNCFRPGGPYEHPKGRACDFSSEQNGFGGDATGNDKLYGNNLAAFLVRNADALGVMYVIWYRQFWSPATGWKSYSGANGDPSSDHTNHVHISML